MGGSLAMALHGQCKSISGLDTDSESVRYAEEKGIVDRASTMPDEILSEATVIILACPVTQILKWIEELPRFFSQRCVVLDLGSTKAQIISKMDKMPQNFDPLGGHPICGKEKLSIKNSEKGLFIDAPFVLVRSKNTTIKGESYRE